MEKNIILEKSYLFGVRIVRLYKYLTEERHEYILNKKLLNSGIEIGAQVKAAQEVGFKEEFTRKIQVAFIEAGRTEYWLKLLLDCDYLSQSEYLSINEDCLEIKRILASILKTAKTNPL